jgi:hypothetical protein
MLLLTLTDSVIVGVVRSVGSNTALTLVNPAAGSVAGVAYKLAPAISYTPTNAVNYPATRSHFLAVAGQRVLRCLDNRAWFSRPYTDSAFASTYYPGNIVDLANDYHQLPDGTVLAGAAGLGGTLVLFTTGGVWTVSNLEFDALDDAGNVQHIVRQINELILWGDPGWAKWRGAFVVPAVDDVWLMGLDGAPEPIGAGIKPLYLSYLKAGYSTGQAAVHRGHYFLPILNGTTWIDTLICRLDRGFAWTRWNGHAAGIANAQRIGATTRTPKLLSISGQRVIELTDAWVPSASNASEADASTHTVTIETRDLPSPGGSKGSTTRKVKVRYQATAAAGPTFTVSYARGPEDAAYTSLGSAIRGGGVSDGLDESVWPVGKQAPAIRFRITSSSALSTFTLRSIAAEYTERGA